MPPPSNRQPIAVITGPLLGRVGELFEVDISQSTDPEGKLRTWRIDWPDGETESGAWPPDASIRQHIFAEAIDGGDVVLTVSDHKKVRSTASLVGVIIEPETEPVPPTPVDCVLGEWTLESATQWGPCQPDGTQSRTARYVRAVLVEPANGGAPCEATVKEVTETQTCLYIPPEPPSGRHPYYDALVARADRLYQWPLRSAAEVDGYPSPTAAGEIPITYDPMIDAAKIEINPAVTGKVEPGQLWLPLLIAPTVSWLLTFDQVWDSNWTYTAGRLKKYKALRFDCQAGSQTGVWGILKHHFDEGVNVGALLRYKMESSGAQVYVVPPTTIESEVIQPQTYYLAQSDRWWRTWVHYDGTLHELSVWSADTVQGTVQMLNKAGYLFPSTGLQTWRLEFDTSGESEQMSNPNAKAWFRNVVVLQGIDYTTAQGLLSTEGL